jgi:hypothetical protein
VRVDTRVYRVHGKGHARPIITTTESVELICDAFLIPVHKEFRHCLSREDDDRLVFPVHHRLEELLTTQIMTRPTRCLEQTLFDDRLC